MELWSTQVALDDDDDNDDEDEEADEIMSVRSCRASWGRKCGPR